MGKASKAKQQKRDEEQALANLTPRERARLMAAKNRGRTGKQRDWFVWGTIIAVVVVVLGVGGFITYNTIQQNQFSTGTQSDTTAQGTIYDGFFTDARGLKVPTGLPSDATGEPVAYDNLSLTQSDYPTSMGTTIDMYVDTSCPHCFNFWSQNESQINQWLNDGTVDQLYIHPLTFIDNYSLAGSNMLACTAQYNPSYLLKVYSYLESLQPTYGEGTANGASDPKKLGASLSKLIYANVSGIPETNEYSTCMASGTFAKWSTSANARATAGPVPLVGNSATNISGTPTIFVNGQLYNGDPTPSSLATFVQEVKAGQEVGTTPDSGNQTGVGTSTDTGSSN